MTIRRRSDQTRAVRGASSGISGRLGLGQAIVEMALVLPIFLLVLFGLIDFGRLVYTNSMVSQAAREGVRVAAVQARWIGKTTADDPGCVVPPAVITSANPGAHVCPNDVPTLQRYINVAANGELVGVAAIPLTKVYLSCDPAAGLAPTGPWTGVTCSSTARSTGDQVSVRVEVAYQPITPIVGSIFGSLLGPMVLSGSATMAIN